MCTVTVLATPADAARSTGAPLVRLVCNRDEQRSRPVSEGPVRRRTGDRESVMPVDPQSGGTWLGANDAGIIACLINTNPPVISGATSDRALYASRGAIVPALLGASTIDEALAAARAMHVTQFPPFRLLVLNARSFFLASSDGASLSISTLAALGSPLLLTSSGLGDHLVESVRRDLFSEMMSGEHDALAAQERFHEHQWKNEPHLSVLMSRADARTVSRCVVELLPDSITLSHSILNDQLAPASPAAHLRLPLPAAAASASH